jgi:transglutaminase-like putative cysteine protease
LPAGTKIALQIKNLNNDASLGGLWVMGESAIADGYAWTYGAQEAYEITLTPEMGADKNGVRIVSAGLELLTALVSAAAAGSGPSFAVKHEIALSDGTTLLCSEKPLRTIAAGYEGKTYVFPLGTKLAQSDGALIPISASSESPHWDAGKEFFPKGDAVYELTLTDAFLADPRGVRITTKSGNSHGLATVRIEGGSPPAPSEDTGKSLDKQMLEWNTTIRDSKSQDAATLAHYRRPSPAIQSDNAEIIALAKSVTAGKTSDYDKTKAIHEWVADNIWYDNIKNESRTTDGLSQPQDAVSVLKSKRAVCKGYTNLSVALLRAAGIPAKLVSGLLRNANDQQENEVFYDFTGALGGDGKYAALAIAMGHDWTEAYADGRWLVMDTTSDSINAYSGAYSEQKSNPRKFHFDMDIGVMSSGYRYPDYGDYFPQDGVNNNAERPEASPSGLDAAAAWAREGVAGAITKGFVPADIQGDYANVITRGEFCRMAVKFVEYKTGKAIGAILQEKGLSSAPGAFSDTNDPDILAAYALGVTSGTGGGKFSPDGQFTREQAATMLMNTCKALGMDADNPPASDFTDLGSASSWAVDGINFVRAKGVMSGTSTTESVFTPKTAYTRQESIVTFDRIK